MKAVIIGGGIGGLSAAIALRQGGIEAHVYERAPELTEVGAGLSLWANGVKALHMLGLGDAISHAACPVHQLGTRTTNRRWLNRISLDPLHDRLGFTSVAIHRGELLQILVNAVDPDAVHPAMKLTGIDHSHDGEVVAVFANGSTVTGDILVGADGVASIIRQQLFPNTAPQYAGYSTWRGVVRSIDLPEDWPRQAIIRTLGCGQYFGVGELGSGRYLWYLTQNLSAESGSTHPGKTNLLHSVASWASPVPEIVEATPDGDILLHPVYKLRPTLRKWHSGRVVLLGDAEHPIEPALGMGAALAFEDALQLAASFSSHRNHLDAFHHYEISRRARVNRLTRWSSFLARSEQLSNPIACRLRDLAIRLPSRTVTLALARRAMTFAPH
jgi:2-polyprenyl-6-methoxyphenol hydroxylase-like FAD-dependent oxidoreductase